MKMADRNGINFELKMKKCPICKKEFHPQPQHSWKIGSENTTGKIVCSYSCMRKWEKEKKYRRRGDPVG